jgi:hypothetical protein
VNGSLAKYNLQDQIIDEFEDATGIDAGNSTNERLTSGVYDGAATVTPSVTSDHDDTGTDGDYTWYKWTDTAATGSYETDTTQDHEYLMVGGGASGASNHGGGGGAGGLLTATGLSLTGGNEYTVTIAAGGAAVSEGAPGDAGRNGYNGGDSILSGTGITTLTAGGGGYGSWNSSDTDVGRATNGNGGGGGYGRDGGAGDGAGFAGGSGNGGGAPQYGAGGGGGAGAVGVDGTSAMSGTDGDGGVGVANDIIETGTDVYYAGGGGGCAYGGLGNCGAGGNGGGGAGATVGGTATSGTANTGGGGGGSTHGGTSGAGGSGIVILRRLTAAIAGGANLTLQSTDTTAMAEPDYADMVMLMENAEGTATINTDIKGYISKDSGVTFTQGTLVDEGTWGTNKKIYAFHDLDISAQSGTSMCYKITTHNQVASSKVTRIHAVSIGWK